MLGYIKIGDKMKKIGWISLLFVVCLSSISCNKLFNKNYLLGKWTGNGVLVGNSVLTGMDSKEVEFFKDLVIPTTEICFRSCVLEFEDHDIVGYPIEIKNESYERIKLVYNCCFVVSKDPMATRNNVNFGH